MAKQGKWRHIEAIKSSQIVVEIGPFYYRRRKVFLRQINRILNKGRNAAFCPGMPRYAEWPEDGYFTTDDAKSFKSCMNDNTIWMAKIPVKLYIGVG